MALPAATVWEVRPTVGSDVAGGGFVTGASGTDYSQQDAKNTAGSNISTTDGVANGTTTFTSATAAFTAAIVGNIIYIAGSWYQVVTYTNATTIVLDRTITTATGLTLNIGGALATVSAAIAVNVAGNANYVKASGSYIVTAQLAIALQNLTSTPNKIIGYTTTRTDKGRFTWTTATDSTRLVTSTSGTPSNWRFENINFTSTAGVKADCFHASSGNFFGVYLKNCIIDGFLMGINGDYAADYSFPNLVLEGCEVKNCTNGVKTGCPTMIIGSWIHDNSGKGAWICQGANNQAGAFTIRNSVIGPSNGIGLYQDAASSSLGGTFSFFDLQFAAIYKNTGDGIYLLNTGGSGVKDLYAINSIFFGNGGWGINSQVANFFLSPVLKTCAFGSNASGNRNNTPTGDGDVAITVDPFTLPGSGDFTLNSTAGGGAVCKAAGFPTVIPST